MMCIINQTKSAICSLAFAATVMLFGITAKAEEQQLPNSTGVWYLIEQQQHIEVTEKTVTFEELKGCKPEVAKTQEIQHTRAEEVIENSAEVMNVNKNRWNIELSSEDRELLAKIVYLEAGNQGLGGQEYVVTVIFNRMTDERFPFTVYDVLSQKDPVQFTTWKCRDKSTPTDETYQAIDDVLSGSADTSITDSQFLYFSVGKGSKKAVKIGGHHFW